MAINEKLTLRVRQHLPTNLDIEEKKMFRGIAFMINGKLCISVGDNEIMCRIDPALHEELIKREGCRTMEMKGKIYRGYIYVNEKFLNDSQLEEWVNLALAFNPKAKASKKN